MLLLTAGMLLWDFNEPFSSPAVSYSGTVLSPLLSSSWWLSLGPASCRDLSQPKAELSQPSPAHQAQGLTHPVLCLQLCASIFSPQLLAEHIAFTWKLSREVSQVALTDNSVVLLAGKTFPASTPLCLWDSQGLVCLCISVPALPGRKH